MARGQHAVYMTEDERERREALADDLDMDFSEFMRKATDPDRVDTKSLSE